MSLAQADTIICMLNRVVNMFYSTSVDIIQCNVILRSYI